MTMFIKVSEQDFKKVVALNENERVVLYEYKTKQGEPFKVTATKKNGYYYFNNFSVDDEKLEYYSKR